MPNGTSTAVTEATRLGEIGFPEFTAKLVKDVFDALLGATLRQMEAYSQLVAATAKTLQEYVSENKNLVSGEEVWDWLTTNLPGPAKDVADNPNNYPDPEAHTTPVWKGYTIHTNHPKPATACSAGFSESSSIKLKGGRLMANKTLTDHKVFGAARDFLVLCAVVMFLSLSTLAQDQGRRSKPEAKAMEQEPTKTKRTVIAPATVSIPDQAALIRALLPYSVPPEAVVVVLRDGTAVRVENLDWIRPATPSEGRICVCPKGGGRICPGTISCADCCRVIVHQEVESLLPDRMSEVDEALRQAGLKRVTNRKRTYPVNLVLFGDDPKPDQYITCMNRNAAGDCTHWRICRKADSGESKCYDVVRFGKDWVVFPLQ
jgi:hypothetical protein